MSPLLSCGRVGLGVVRHRRGRVGRVVLDAFDLEVLVRTVRAAVLAEEREVDAARHVGRGHERADEPDDDEQLVVVVAGVDEDLVLRPEAREREDAGQRERADHERLVRLRHVLPQPTHVLLHVEGVVRTGVAHRARAEEEVGLEERVREEVEHRRGPRADAERHHHVAELADRGVREHLLDVVLHERERGSDQHGDAADRGHGIDAAVADREAVEEHRVDARAEVDAGDDHRRGVDQRGHRRGTGHGVGQPGVQRELTRLADDREHQRGRGPEDERVAHLRVRRGAVELDDVERVDARGATARRRTS